METQKIQHTEYTEFVKTGLEKMKQTEAEFKRKQQELTKVGKFGITMKMLNLLKNWTNTIKNTIKKSTNAHYGLKQYPGRVKF